MTHSLGLQVCSIHSNDGQNTVSIPTVLHPLSEACNFSVYKFYEVHCSNEDVSRQMAATAPDLWQHIMRRWELFELRGRDFWRSLDAWMLAQLVLAQLTMSSAHLACFTTKCLHQQQRHFFSSQVQSKKSGAGCISVLALSPSLCLADQRFKAWVADSHSAMANKFGKAEHQWSTTH